MYGKIILKNKYAEYEVNHERAISILCHIPM